MKTLIGLCLSMLLLSKPATNSFMVTGTVYNEQGNTIPGVTVIEKGYTKSVTTDVNGFYSIEVTSGSSVLIFSYVRYATKKIFIKNRKIIDVTFKVEQEVLVEADVEVLEETVVVDYVRKKEKVRLGRPHKLAMPSPSNTRQGAVMDMSINGNANYYAPVNEPQENFNTEGYATIHENGFKKVTDMPLSTFSIDVDAASYSNMRRFINNGQMPPVDAVRIEEMINYFNYTYDEPHGNDPFSINTEVSYAPWNDEHLLVQVGLQGKRIATDNLPASNLVFLLDVSGSMNNANKLPLLKASLKMLTNEMRPSDKVSIVVYAGAAGLVLPPTAGTDKRTIMEALDKLSAGGSTAGGAGINLAYKVAKEQFIDGGNNRIILATDGDFNIGASSDAEMERLIEEKRKGGIFLTVLGFGMGNYKDSKMEILADKGNGNYAYIDNIREAKKVLVNEFGGTLFAIAKDVKIQVEFNPAKVQGYRLIGYENRLLNAEDFNDDKKDAGELGSGHTVTALYEIIPKGVESSFIKNIDPLKYQSIPNIVVDGGNDLLTVKFRYKKPDGMTSKLITQTLNYKISRKMSENLTWSAAVAGFGMMLRNSQYKGSLTYNQVETLAKSAKGNDLNGYRKEFIDLVNVVNRIAVN